MSLSVLSSSLGPLSRRSSVAAALTYAQTVLADSPLGYWRQGDASGIVAADASGNVRHGTRLPNSGGDWTGTNNLLGQTGIAGAGGDTAAKFGGTGYVSLGDLSAGEDKTFSYECWYKGTHYSNGTLVFEGNSGSTTQLSWMYILNSKLGVYWRNDAGATASTSGATTINNDAWHHLVVTCDGSHLRIYVDGALDATAVAVPAGAISLNTASIAATIRTTVSNYVVGILDEVAIYGTALSLTRIQAHYNRGIAA